MNLLVGPNGSGKTALLEAIYYGLTDLLSGLGLNPPGEEDWAVPVRTRLAQARRRGMPEMTVECQAQQGPYKLAYEYEQLADKKSPRGSLHLRSAARPDPAARPSPDRGASGLVLPYAVYLATGPAGAG